ncbi:MAG: CHC2 zinc finger domain-containing protein, partial [Acidobacteriota bacterium]
MARIPQAELEKLKQEVSLERLVEAKGVELARHGQDLIGLCPFHDDKEPSLVISPRKNLWHCLGTCQAGGSVIDWVMKAEGVSFRHAVELLRHDSPSLAAPLIAAGGPAGGRSATDGRRHVKHPKTQKLAPVLERDVDDARLLVQVVDYYHASLKESPEALAYLDKRGLRAPDMVEHFRLGFANRTLGYRLPLKARADGAELRGRLQKLGLLRESGHEHFRGSLVIPIFGDDGQVLGMYGRKVGERLRNGTPPHLYLPGPHRGVFNIEALGASEEIILCEALLDALTFWC